MRVPKGGVTVGGGEVAGMVLPVRRAGCSLVVNVTYACRTLGLDAGDLALVTLALPPAEDGGGRGGE